MKIDNVTKLVLEFYESTGQSAQETTLITKFENHYRVLEIL